jgi:hypothetical protein
MSRLRWLLILGLTGAVAAYCLGYFGRLGMAGHAAGNQLDELSWLKKEFRLGEADFARIEQLHQRYLPHCREMCAQVDAINQRLKDLLATTNQVTPEIEQALADAAQTRTKCQVMMFEHFYEVSRAMPPEQGRRYLDWVQRHTLLPTYHSNEPSRAITNAPGGHQHH